MRYKIEDKGKKLEKNSCKSASILLMNREGGEILDPDSGRGRKGRHFDGILKEIFSCILLYTCAAFVLFFVRVRWRLIIDIAEGAKRKKDFHQKGANFKPESN